MNLDSLQSLQDYQEYMREKYAERGFTGQTVPELFLLWMEEIGEFARAAREQTNVASKRPDKVVCEEVALEAADVFNYLLEICNELEIDLEAAFKEKERINDGRRWTE